MAFRVLDGSIKLRSDVGVSLMGFIALVCIFISGLSIEDVKPCQYVNTVNTFFFSDHKNGQHFIIPQMADR